MSNVAAPTAIISMAQHARPNVIGQIEERRAQFSSQSTFVQSTLSSSNLFARRAIGGSDRLRLLRRRWGVSSGSAATRG
jgi:hypothetical protein